MRMLRLVVLLAATTSLGAAQGPSVTSVGVGCQHPGTLLTPVMWTTQIPILGNSGFYLAVSNVPPGTFNWFFGSLGTTSSAINIGGTCNVYLEPVSMMAFFDLGISPIGPLWSDPWGTALVTVPIPSSPALSGLTLGFQAAIIGQYTSLGVGLSNALEVHIE